MSYMKRNDVPVADGWTVVEFDDGSLAKVRCDKKTVPAGVCYHAQAEAIDAAGVTLPDPAGKALVTDFKHPATIPQIELHGDSAITTAVLLLVMGEPTDLIPWSDGTRNSTGTNIRARVKAALVAGPADAGAVL